MDKEMPGLDGIQAARHIRQLGYSGVLALVSGSLLNSQLVDDLRTAKTFDFFFVKGDNSLSWKSLFR
jgi:CheY-like chemotaxis protein